MIVMNGEEFLTAQEACKALGVKAATLYAYVSRGILRSYRQGIRRTRLYRRDEVEQLTRLREPDEAVNHDDAAGGTNSTAWIPYV
ncbi:MAG TPA: helix-turn-helix domain-containing protein [Ktedonobacterales bacterium]|jgi:citrate synthase|nr:helix-turn-helix domain-containing protein [Ktedonobacterales bacterium]